MTSTTNETVEETVNTNDELFWRPEEDKEWLCDPCGVALVNRTCQVIQPVLSALKSLGLTDKPDYPVFSTMTEATEWLNGEGLSSINWYTKEHGTCHHCGVTR
jgi:hypothetical protein